MAKCKVCGYRLGEGVTKCPMCGATAGSTIAGEISPELNLPKYFCPSCNSQILGEHRYCPSCGIDLKEAAKKVENLKTQKQETAEEKKCVKCGVVLTPNAKFCPECGAKQEVIPVEKASKELARAKNHKTESKKAQKKESLTTSGGLVNGKPETPMEAFEYEIEDGLYILKNLKGKYRSRSKIVIPKVFSIIGVHNSTNSELGFEGAFQNCTKLTQVIIPDTVFFIDVFAFKDCTSLNSINIPKSVKGIASGAFFGCSSLHNLDLPDSVEEIGSHAFMKSGIEDIKLPNSLTKIDFRTFAECNCLDHIEIPNSITDIEAEAFRHSGLYEISIPESVRYIGNYSFDSCYQLKKIEILNSKYNKKDITRIFGYGFQCKEVTIGNELIKLSKLTGLSGFFKSVGYSSYVSDIENSINLSFIYDDLSRHHNSEV